MFPEGSLNVPYLHAPGAQLQQPEPRVHAESVQHAESGERLAVASRRGLNRSTLKRGSPSNITVKKRLATTTVDHCSAAYRTIGGHDRNS
jgi:hypothetical protein